MFIPVSLAPRAVPGMVNALSGLEEGEGRRGRGGGEGTQLDGTESHQTEVHWAQYLALGSSWFRGTDLPVN